MKRLFRSIFFVVAISGIHSNPAVRACDIIVGTADGFGVDSLTIDTNTGLEWLDWTESTNISYPDIVEQFGSGGDFEGFRHATSREIITLLRNLDVGFILDDYMNFEEGGAVAAVTPDNGESLSAALSYVGQTGTFDGRPSAWAITGDPLPDPSDFGLRPNSEFSPGVLLEIARDGSSVVNNAISAFRVGNFQIGHALVRQTIVPEPASFLCLLGLGILGLTGRRRLQ